MKSIVILAAVILTGCAAPVETYRPGTPPEQIAASKECKYQAELATAGMRSPIEIAFARSDLRQSCMAAKGYY